MHTIKVLGTGCANCRNTVELLTRLARELGAPVEIVKVEDLPSIMAYGIMATPGVVIDEKLVHAGGMPSRKAALGWLEGLQ